MGSGDRVVDMSGDSDRETVNFFIFCGLKLEIGQTRKIDLILPILTEFDRF
jgi:hypothetical protein